MNTLKITVDGHGGHCCQASLDGTGLWEAGYSIEDAVGRLIRQHPEHFGIELDILPCSTTAYKRSDPPATHGQIQQTKPCGCPPYVSICGCMQCSTSPIAEAKPVPIILDPFSGTMWGSGGAASGGSWECYSIHNCRS